MDAPAPPCKINYMTGQPEQPITEVLRRAIAVSGRPFKALERETGVLRQSLMKFSRGEQTLRGDAFDRLAVYFGLELRPKQKG
jgi:hypothetical protein